MKPRAFCSVLAVMTLWYVAGGPAAGERPEPLRARLQARIQVSPDEPVLPGRSIDFYVAVKNTGNASSPPGTVAIRFVPRETLSARLGLTGLQSEPKPLPAIPPGKTTRVDFAQNHPLASIKSAEAFEWLGKNLYSFLGEVPLGHYEAVATVAGTEAVVGKRHLSLTLFYRSTPGEKLRAEFPVP